MILHLQRAEVSCGVATMDAPTADSMSGDQRWRGGRLHARWRPRVAADSRRDRGRRRWPRISLRKSRCDADGDGDMRSDWRDGMRSGTRRAEVHKVSAMSRLQHHGPETRRQRSARPWRGRLCAGVTCDVCSVSVMAAAKADEWRCGAVTRSRRASSTTGKVMPMLGESVRDRQ